MHSYVCYYLRIDKDYLRFQSVPREHIRQAFQSLIKDSTDGSIDSIAYCDTLAKLKGPSFTKYLKDNLLGVRIEMSLLIC